jgi:diacylglycerol kinase family enzyme
MPGELLVVYNPVSGNRTTHAFFEQHVFPFLGQHQLKVDKVIQTEHQGHAGQAVVEYVLASQKEELTVVLGSGDGTLHEIINALATTESPSGRALLPKLCFVLIPCGTANALYHSLFLKNNTTADINDVSYRLKSLDSLLSSSQPIPLTLAISNVYSSPAAKSSAKVVVSAVVTSTALHAAILRDSESLREEHPGIER